MDKDEIFSLSYKDTKLMIFEMNGYDWWVDTDLESAIKNYRQFQNGKVDDEDIETKDTFAISKERAERLKYFDSDGDKQTRTFAAQLQFEIEKGRKFPDFFASTEY